jgi:hypothetical protein
VFAREGAGPFLKEKEFSASTTRGLMGNLANAARPSGMCSSVVECATLCETLQLF